MLPITRSAYGFCHGDAGAVTTSSIPRLLILRLTALPYMRSPSRRRNR
jgi:hypothetical protein